jgi:hypothetical protein
MDILVIMVDGRWSGCLLAASVSETEFIDRSRLTALLRKIRRDVHVRAMDDDNGVRRGAHGCAPARIDAAGISGATEPISSSSWRAEGT